MNPVVIIPTYISTSRRRNEVKGVVSVYDHTTDLRHPGELGRCLKSLEGVSNIGLVLVLAVADRGIEEQAVEKVRATCNDYPALNTVVIGHQELAIVRERMEQLGIERVNQQIGLSGYGATRNLGMVLACAFGFDSAVFVDDCEIVDDPDFLHKAMYGLGKLTKNGIPILAKTGYYINEEGSYLSNLDESWYNRFWQIGPAFNAWISKAMQGPRLSRSNVVCAGCLAIHKEAFKRLSFDAWIPRGEGLDYMLDLRMFGSDIWFDNKWQLRRMPPPKTREGTRFRQDIFRWIYEYFKLQHSYSLIDLQKVTATSLDPYPGPCLKKGLRWRISLTALLRSFACSDKKAYRQAALHAAREAIQYSESNCTKYFEFQHIWPQIMDRIDSDKIMTTALVQSSLIEPLKNSAAAAASDVPAAGIDPGLSGQIRLDMGE